MKFKDWFKDQTERSDKIGELARAYPKPRNFYHLTDLIEAKHVQSSPEMVRELGIAYQALEEWENIS